MDVVSTVIAISGTVVAIGNAITLMKGFVAGVRNVDKEVGSFIEEFSLLDALLSAIKANLETCNPKAGANVETLDLWKLIEDSVRDCGEKVKKINEVMEELSMGGGDAYQSLTKHLKLKSRSDSIAKCRRQVQLYINIFQTAASSLTICSLAQCSNLLAGSDIAAVFGLRMDNLAEQMNRLEQTLQSAIIEPELREQAEDRVFRNVVHCMASARAIYSSASTVDGSTTASEFGIPLPRFRVNHIENWVTQHNGASKSQSIPSRAKVNDILNTELEPGPSSDPGSTAITVRINESRALGIANYGHGDLAAAEDAFSTALEIAEKELDPSLAQENVDVFELRLWLALSLPAGKSSHDLKQDWVLKVKLIDHYYKVAQRHMWLWEFGKAQKSLLGAINIGRDLRIPLSTLAIDLKRIMLMLALAYARQRDAGKAARAIRTLEMAWESMKTAASITQLRMIEHTYLLALTYFYLDDLPMAQALCNEAMNNAAHISEASSEYLRAVMLMVALSSAMGEPFEADFWLERVPEEFLEGEIEPSLSAHNLSLQALKAGKGDFNEWAIDGEEISAIVYVLKLITKNTKRESSDPPNFITSTYKIAESNGVQLIESSLNRAARGGSLAFTSILLAHDVDKNNGTTKIMLDNGGIPRLKEGWSSPIHAAIARHRQRVVELLLRHRVDWELSGHYACAALKGFRECGELWDQQPRPNRDCFLKPTMEIAILAEDSKSAWILYQESLKKNPEAHTPLYHALFGLSGPTRWKTNFPEACIIALSEPPSTMTNSEIINYGPPLHIALRKCPNAVCGMIKAGISPTMTNQRGDTALHALVRGIEIDRGKGIYDIDLKIWEATARAMVTAGCPIDTKNKAGFTALHTLLLRDHRGKGWAAEDESFTRILLELGADVRIKAWDGRLPIEMLSDDIANSNIKKILREAGMKDDRSVVPTAGLQQIQENAHRSGEKPKPSFWKRFSERSK